MILFYKKSRAHAAARCRTRAQNCESDSAFAQHIIFPLDNTLYTKASILSTSDFALHTCIPSINASRSIIVYDKHLMEELRHSCLGRHQPIIVD